MIKRGCPGHAGQPPAGLVATIAGKAMKPMKAKLALLVILALLAVLLTGGLAYAQVGVGVNLGKISVDEPLMPGGSYRLPSVGVINSGTVTSDYEMEVSYHHQQKELMPSAEWVEFDPKTFTLEPGQSRPVAVTLNIPVGAKPGDYFAYLEVHPVAKEGGVAIGIAAATKLYFSVKPANIVSAVTSRVSTFFEANAPFSWVGLGVLFLIVVVLLFRRFVHISFKVERKG